MQGQSAPFIRGFAQPLTSPQLRNIILKTLGRTFLKKLINVILPKKEALDVLQNQQYKIFEKQNGSEMQC
jgi:hypothetical protein